MDNHKFVNALLPKSLHNKYHFSFTENEPNFRVTSITESYLSQEILQ